MKTYKNKKDGFKEIRKKALKILLPLTLGALMLGGGIAYMQTASGKVNTLPFLIILGLGVGGYGIFKGMNRQRKIFESYILKIDQDTIQREQLNTPTVTIRKSDIQTIQKGLNGSLIVRGINRSDFIIISNQIDHYEDFENDLNQLGEIQVLPSKTLMEKLSIPLVLSVLVLMAVVYLSTNRYLVLFSGVFLALGLMWSFYEVQTSKNLDSKTKRNSWWTILVIVVIISITYSKFVG